MNSFWDENDVSEYELLEESIEAEQSEPVVYEPEDIDDEVLEEIVEESAFDLDEHQAATVYNARVRLEQANLYEMLINHNLFDGVDASEQAVSNVQNELKYFIVGRLELLLGIRQPKSRVVESQFGEDEVDFIKALAAKGLAMQGRQPSAPAPKPVSTVKSGLKPLTQKKKVAVSKPAQRSVKKKVEQAKKEVEEKPLPTKPKTTRKRKAPAKKAAPKEKKPRIASDGVLTQRNMTKAEIEEMAKRDIQKLSQQGKSFFEMSKKEKQAHLRKKAEEDARKPTPENATPMASFEQQQMKYMTEQQQRAGTGSDMSKFNSVLANALAMQKAQEIGD